MRQRSDFGTILDEATRLLDNWRKAVDNTDAIKRLRKVAAQSTDQPLRDHYRYLLSREETFARSYAQYIATKSQSPRMLSELEWMRRDSGHEYRQWSDVDFEPVANAFDELLAKLKWLK